MFPCIWLGIFQLVGATNISRKKKCFRQILPAVSRKICRMCSRGIHTWCGFKFICQLFDGLACSYGWAFSNSSVLLIFHEIVNCFSQTLSVVPFRFAGCTLAVGSSSHVKFRHLPQYPADLQNVPVGHPHLVWLLVHMSGECNPVDLFCA